MFAFCIAPRRNRGFLLRLPLAPLFLACIPITLCMGQDAANDTLRVLTYNIHHAQGTDGKLDVVRIAAVIRDADPDIVALQEVDQEVSRSQTLDQPAELARLTGMVAIFGGNIRLQGGQYGNAILTRLAIRKSENRLLPRHRDGEQRGVLVAVLDWKTSQKPTRPISFFATHLDHRRDSSERIASVESINRMATDEFDGMMILAGDLNAARDSREIRLLESHWTIAGPELPTIPVAKPIRQIDFVLFRPKARWKVVETRVIDEAVASDHRALLTVLQAL